MTPPRTWPVMLALAVLGCGGPTAAPTPAPRPSSIGNVGPTAPTAPTPRGLVEALIAAAASDDFAALPAMCDPAGEGDGDTRVLCALTEASPRSDQLREVFARAIIVDERVDGDRAEVEVLLGPEASWPETMHLVRRGDRWYLSSF